MSSAQPTQPSGSGRARRLGILGVLGLITAVAVGAFLVWFVFFSSEAPDAPTIEGAAAGLQATPAVEVTPAAAETAGTHASAAATQDAGAVASSAGTWSVDTSIGDPEQGTNSFVGFRVAEVLDLIGATVAIGRTPAVDGQLELDGTTLQSATIEADLTRITSDRSRRDRPIQRALETSEHPTATFESTGPVELGALPTSEETIAVTIPGVLTIHGVAQPVEVDMDVRRVGDVVVVVGSLPVEFSAFDVRMPTAPVVVSVEDRGDLEWQLFFRPEA